MSESQDALPHGWEQTATPEGQVYFINHNNGTTSWHDPRMYPTVQMVLSTAPTSLLESIMRTYNPFKGNEQAYMYLNCQLAEGRQKYFYEGTPENLRRMFVVFQAHISVPNFPPMKSDGGQMVEEMYTEMEILISGLVQSGRLDKATLHKMMLECMINLLKTGPNNTAAVMVHRRMVETCGYHKYLQQLSGKDLTRVIDTLKQWTHTNQNGISVKEHSKIWGDCVERIVDLILGEDSNSPKLKAPGVKEEFLDLYMFYSSEIAAAPKEYNQQLEAIMYKIEKKCGSSNNTAGNPYEALDQPDTVLKHWAQKKGLVTTDQTGKNKAEVKKAEKMICLMIDAIGKKGWIVERWDDIVDLVRHYSLVHMDTPSEKLPILSSVLKLLEKTPSEKFLTNPEIVDKMLPAVTEILQKCPDHFNWVCNVEAFLQKKCTLTKTSAKDWIPIMKGFLKYEKEWGAWKCSDLLQEGKFRKIWNWKKNFRDAQEIVQYITKAYLNKKDKPLESDKMLLHHGNAIGYILEQFALASIQEKISGEIAELAITMMENRSKAYNKFVAAFVPQISLEKSRHIIPDMIERLSVLFCDENYIWDDTSTQTCGSSLILKTLEAYSTGKEIPADVNGSLIQMFLYAMQTEDLDYIEMEFGRTTVHGLAATQYLSVFASKHVGTESSHVCARLVPAMVKQIKHENEMLSSASQFIVYNISTKDPKLMAGEMGALAEWYNSKNSTQALNSLMKPYEESVGFTQNEFNTMMTAIEEDTAQTNEVFQILFIRQMAEHQPEFFTQRHVDFIIKHFVPNHETQMTTLIALSDVIPQQPELFGNNIIRNVLQNPKLDMKSAAAIQVICVNLGLKEKELSDSLMEELIVLTKKSKDANQQVAFVDALRTLGAKYGVNTLKPHRKYFEDLQKNGQNSSLKDMSTAIINAMDGVSMTGITTEVLHIKRQVGELDERVTQTEVEVKGLKVTVDKHGREIKSVKSGLKTVNKRVDGVQKDLDDTRQMVEEIDNKTMSNAPAWSRDVTKLMNPKSDHDWRLLAQRLGYSPKDIKAWANQNDPCMALLSEWYATHRTVEATQAVLTILQEMNRLDAAVIVENALKAVEDIVVEASDYKKPPPIFLSYQWGHQNEVKLLRQHLLMAGYECWMDVGQMGGGDKLFEKIDNGIRGSKVVICCVSEKYAKSPNCNREVNLAVNLGKPMIPLLMEKMGWPPKGSMGPIFSEYLFVRFFQRGGEETDDQRYWPVPKFQELLMQLNIYKTMPDESIITKEYKKWWVPVAEEIIINKKTNTGGQGDTNSSSTKEDTSKSPDVFLSYQWGKQKQIKRLYKRLTELGLTCWMDIYQMGGGDSLYDKIDRGVRGCKIVLTCVTNKYAVSANCRREVSLADSLKKPVVPLLLEKMDWPPSGPMSMVFTQLLFINFYRDEEVQMSWTGDKFDELLAKVMEHVPNTIGYEPPKRDDDDDEPRPVPKTSPPPYKPNPEYRQSQQQPQTQQYAQPQPYQPGQPYQQAAQPYAQSQPYGYGQQQQQHQQQRPQANQKSSSCVLL